MTRYDLAEFRSLRWVRFMDRFRLGLRALVVGSGLGVAYNVDLALVVGSLSSARLAAVAGLVLLWGLFAGIAASMRASAAGLVVDDEGITLEYAHGRVDRRSWRDPRIRIRGRRTAGVDDVISQGRPMQSIFGPSGGISESWVPKAALEEIFVKADQLGLLVSEPDGPPGWKRYSITR